MKSNAFNEKFCNREDIHKQKTSIKGQKMFEINWSAK